MNEYMFGSSQTQLTRAQARKITKIAHEHGAYLVETTLPGIGYVRWFACRNRGNPYDQAVERAVVEACAREGLAHE